MDALELKMHEAKFEGYCEGKRVMKQWAKNCQKHIEENPEW